MQPPGGQHSFAQVPDPPPGYPPEGHAGGYPPGYPPAGYPGPGYGGYYGQQWMGYPPGPPKVRSGAGVWSVVVGIVSGLLLVTVIGIAAAREIRNPGSLDEMPEDSPQMMTMGLFVCGAGLGNVVGLVLGIVGLSQRDRFRGMPLAGTLINGLLILLMLFLMAMGSKGG